MPFRSLLILYFADSFRRAAPLTAFDDIEMRVRAAGRSHMTIEQKAVCVSLYLPRFTPLLRRLR